MSTQRDGSATDSSGGSTRRSATRRGFLGALGAGVAGLSGCVGSASVLGGGRAVSVLAAGSLQSAFEDGLAAAVEPTLEVEAHGSVTVARLVDSGRRDPDVVALADTALFDRTLASDWHADFATNSLVVAYDSDTNEGRRVAEADRWFDPVLAGEASLGRTDPDLDPLGYRTLFALDLASDHYDEPRLPQRVLRRDQIYPETSLLSRFETGAVDAAVVYRSMAVERDYEFVDLPAAIDLGDPDLTEVYERVNHAIPDGETIRGAPIRYGALARSDDDAVRDVFGTLVDGEYLGDHGFGRPDGFPTYSGEVPDGFGA